MKHRDRVQLALNHETPDRCPMQISFTPEFAARLRAEMELGGDKLHNPHGGGNTYELERALGEDMLLTSVGWANSYYQDAWELHRRVGRHLEIVAYDDTLWHGPLHRDVGLPLADDDAIDRYPRPIQTGPNCTPTRPG